VVGWVRPPSSNGFPDPVEQRLSGVCCVRHGLAGAPDGVRPGDVPGVPANHVNVQLGDPVAQAYLGMMYQDGIAVRMNVAKAAYWYEKAAEQGNDRGQSSLALLYEQGQGVTQDFVKAAYWHLKAAEQGNDGSQKNLGDLYSHGMGVEKDYDKAVFWYRKAAAQGNQDALNRLKELRVPIEEPK